MNVAPRIADARTQLHALVDEIDRARMLVPSTAGEAAEALSPLLERGARHWWKRGPSAAPFPFVQDLRALEHQHQREAVVAGIGRFTGPLDAWESAIAAVRGPEEAMARIRSELLDAAQLSTAGRTYLRTGDESIATDGSSLVPGRLDKRYGQHEFDSFDPGEFVTAWRNGVADNLAGTKDVVEVRTPSLGYTQDSAEPTREIAGRIRAHHGRLYDRTITDEAPLIRALTGFRDRMREVAAAPPVPYDATGARADADRWLERFANEIEVDGLGHRIADEFGARHRS